jgi:hypothetical protein
MLGTMTKVTFIQEAILSWTMTISTYIYLLVASCQMRIISHRNLQLSSSILMLNKLKFWLSSSIHTIRGLDWDLYWHIKLYWHTFIKKKCISINYLLNLMKNCDLGSVPLDNDWDLRAPNFKHAPKFKFFIKL